MDAKQLLDELHKLYPNDTPEVAIQKHLAETLLSCKTPEELQQVPTTPDAVFKLCENNFLSGPDTQRILSVIDPNYAW